MSLESLIKLFEDYGWPGVIAIVVILVLYYFISKKDKKSLSTINDGFTNLTKTITTQNDKLVDAITESNERTQSRLFELVSKSIDDKEQLKERAHRESMSKRSEISEYIDDILFEILQTVAAQRVILVEFHNSKENLDGLSFLWYDVQHEKQQKGISTISAKARNMQATNLRPIIRRVNNDKAHIAVFDEAGIEEIYNESTVLYNYLKELNCNHLIYIGVYNTETNDLRALIGIEWQEGHPYHEDLVDYYLLKEKAGMIEHLYNQARIDLEESRNAEGSQDVKHIL